MVNDWFYNECQNQFRPYGAIMIPPLRGYWDSAPTGLLGFRPYGAIGIPPLRGYCAPSEAEGWGIISATIFPLLITPGSPAPG
ncbi:MAG: hypothetical protein RJA11_1096 [Bacteroidota bacterium]